MSYKKIFVLLVFFLTSLTSFAGEKDVYSFDWLDPDKEVYVLQNRKYRKKGKFHLNLGAGTTTSGAFVDASTLQGRAGYFFMEDWGFELIYAKNSGTENATATSVRSEGTAGSIPFRRIVDGYTGAMVLWSPFYAKINTFNTIIYLDWFVGAGVAKIDETNNKEEFLNTGSRSTAISESHNGFMWDTGLKFHINENWDTRLDLTVVHFQAEKAATTSTEKIWYSNWDLAFSIGYSF